MKRSIIDDKSSDAVQLSAKELQRYSRHLIMPEVTLDGQRRLKAARVLCIGAGGLGSPAALYLAAAGVGAIGIVDFDDVDLSNLQRQILHGTKDIGAANWNLRGIACGMSIQKLKSNYTTAVSPARTRPNSFQAATWSSMVRIIFRPAIYPTMSVFLNANRMCTAQYSGLRGRLRCSRLI